MKGERSLKARALQLLAQRDQSRLELRRKLLRHARALGAQQRVDAHLRSDAHRLVGADADADAVVGLDAGAGDPGSEVDALLDWLEANRFLSDQRFAESRVHARQARFGVARIRHELGQHGVALSASAAEALAGSELERAAAVRERRFACPPVDAADRAAQSRFLLGRGFSPEIVQRLMRRLRRPGHGSADSPPAAD